MEERKMLPVGIENFEEIRTEGFYYVDKTGMIKELLENRGKVNLFTRPRRFGKTLNMSMLKSFFEIGCNRRIFEGLAISEDTVLCEKYLGKFPVVSVSLKGVNADSLENARAMLAKILNGEARRLQFLLDSDRLTETDKILLSDMLGKDMEEDTLVYGIRELTELLGKHYGQKVIVLIDEYDVPLAKADESGYYDGMVLLIRNLLENVLKTNDNLYFAVLTGCLRVAKESIFTGLNNFNVYSITDMEFDQYFGFTDWEVREMLHYYGQDSHYEAVKEWYDGYRFGGIDMYCPWDVINYCKAHRKNPELPPKNYWLNTSGNDFINRFIGDMGEQQKVTKAELEQLVNGGSVQKEIHQELTYKELYSNLDHIWSALFMTGYLTQRGEPDGDRYHLVIPNREIRNIITEHILTRFKKEVEKDGAMLNAFCNALLDGNAGLVEQLFVSYLGRTISVRDTFVRKATKENFYHGILLGILCFKADWIVESNRESGNGFSDIMIQAEDEETGIVIEVKYAQDGEERKECQKAIEQIESNRYAEVLRQAGMRRILKYGIACNRKNCCVVAEEEAQGEILPGVQGEITVNSGGREVERHHGR